VFNIADYFDALNGRKFRFVRMVGKNQLLVWEFNKNEYGMLMETCTGLDCIDVAEDTLKSIGVWDQLEEKVKQEISAGITTQTKAVHERMADARSGKRKKYIDVPKELVCIKCGKKQNIQPSVTAKVIEKMVASGVVITASEYVKNWQCPVCNPKRRGKKANPEFAGLPKKMTCKCGKSVPANFAQLKKKAELMGTTLQKLMEGFKCQVCEPTKKFRRKKV
jgi:rubredoxin